MTMNTNSIPSNASPAPSALQAGRGLGLLMVDRMFSQRRMEGVWGIISSV